MKQLCKKGLSLLLVALLLTAMLPLSAVAAGEMVTIQTLYKGTATDPATDPAGKVVLKPEGSTTATAATVTAERTSVGTFTADTSTLDPGATYEVWVNGFKTKQTVTEESSTVDITLYEIKFNKVIKNGGGVTENNKAVIKIEGVFDDGVESVYLPDGANNESGDGPKVELLATADDGFAVTQKTDNTLFTYGEFTWSGNDIGGSSTGFKVDGDDKSSNPAPVTLLGLKSDVTIQDHFVIIWTVTVEVQPKGSKSTAVFEEDALDAALIAEDGKSATASDYSFVKVVFKADGGEKLQKWGMENGKQLYEGSGGGTKIDKPENCKLDTVYFKPAANNAKVIAYVETPDTTITYDWNYTEADPKTEDHTGAPGTADSTPPTAPTREGYTFEGWYQESTCENKATPTFPAAGEGPVTYYAKWTEEQSTIIYKWNKWTTGSDPDVTHTGTPDAKDTPPAAPSRPGFDFLGWYDETGHTEIDADSIVFPPNGETVTYYARWTPAAPTEYAVTVRLHVDNAPWDTGNPTLVLYPKDGGESIRLTDRSRETFSGTATNGEYKIGIIVAGQTASSDTKQTITVNGAPASAEVNCYNVNLVMKTDAGAALTAAAGNVKVTHGESVSGTTMTTSKAFVVLDNNGRAGLPIAASEFNHDKRGTDGKHYHFNGWTASHGVAVADANDPTTTFSLPGLETLTRDTTITRDNPITIIATYQAVDSVSFHSNAPEGTIPDPADVVLSEGGKLTKDDLKAPGTPEHYDFDGWYTEPTGGEKVDENTTFTHPDDDLYAHWTAKKYPVTFYRNDGNGTDAVHYTTEAAYNSKLSPAPTNPTRTDYNFRGWTADQAGKQPGNFTTGVVTGPMNFYAQWTHKDAPTYTATVTVKKDNASLAGQTVTLHHGSVDTPMTAGAEGDYTATVTDGTYAVYVGGVDTGKTVVVSGAAASAEVNYYTVRVALATDKGEALTTAAANVQAGHGAAKAAEQVFLAQAAAQPGLPLTASENNHGGPGTDGQHYHFYDWKADAATGVTVADDGTKAVTTFTLPAEGNLTGNAAITPATPITITARFQAQDSISFDLNAPEDGDLKAPEDQFVDPAGDPLPYPDEALKSPGDLPHYTFDGWYTEKEGGEKVDKDTVLHGPDHLYAHWTANEYDVTFHMNDGTATAADPDADRYGASKMVDYNVTVPEPDDPTRSGYKFDGWYTDPACTTEADFTKGIAGDTDFYAKWTANRVVSSSGGSSRRDDCKVTYLLGLYGSTPNGTTETVRYNAKPQAVPSVTAQDAYQFLGWSRTGPTGDIATDAARTLVDPTTVSITSDTTFYAVYQQVHAQPAKPDHSSYVIGYPDGTFGPGDNIDRASVATIIARAVLPDFKEGSDYGNPGNYSDVDGHWAASAIAYCSKYGVFTGYADGTFRPSQSISRQELALVIARLDGVLSGDAVPFSDGDQIGDWAKDGVYTAYTKGWVSGYPDGTFKPQAPIRRDEAVKVFNAFLGRGVDAAGLSGLTEYVHTGAASNNQENGSTEYMTWSDVPKDQWAYYEIIEAANDHTCDTSKTSLPEKWLRCWIDERWNYHD